MSEPASKIWKYVLPVPTGSFTVPINHRDVILSVQAQGSLPTMWVLKAAGPDTNPSRSFFWVATGQPMIRSGVYIATVQIPGLLNTLILHLFEG